MTISERQKKDLSPQLRSLTKVVGKALGDFAMIKEGDRILVAVSGGKGSMLLWEMMKYFQQVAPIDFAIQPAFVDTGRQSFSVQGFQEYFCRQGFPCLVVKKRRDCRGKKVLKCLLPLRKRCKFNKIALGLSLDDMAEEALFNFFYHGEIGAVIPRQGFSKCGNAVICPLAYVHRQEIEKIPLPEGLRVFQKTPCRKDHDPRRQLVRQLLVQVEKGNSAAKKNVVQALRNIKWEYLP